MTAEKIPEPRLGNTQSRFVLPKGAREIILVRHGSSDGQSVDTVELGEITCFDPPLHASGRAQAQALAQRLQHEPVSHIFVTTLKRTHETAAPLVALTGIQPVVIPELREVHMGDWEQEFHHRSAAGDPLVTRMIDEETWDVIPNAEPMKVFAERIRIGIEKIVSILEPDTAGIAICHGGTIGQICVQTTQSRPFAFFGPENTSVSRLVVQANGRWSLRTFNDVSHLTGRE